MKKIFIFAAFLSFVIPCFSETVKLKSGKTITGKVIEKNADSIKVEINGVYLTYFYDDIENIDGVAPGNKRGNASSSPVTTGNAALNIQDRRRIHEILKKLDYPESAWAGIEGELAAFFAKTDLSRLKKEAAQAKSNSNELRKFVSRLGEFMGQEGYINPKSPHPLTKLLIAGLGSDDIFQVVDTSPISQQEKEKVQQDLISCSVVSQLGFIVLKLLDIDVKVATSRDHVFNFIPLDDGNVIFADFLNRVFAIVDLSFNYKLEGKYWTLKEECRVDPEKIAGMKARYSKGVQPATPNELFNCLYFSFSLTDACGATSSIYDNRGYAHYGQGASAQAISDYTKAIEINPDNAEAYGYRGLTFAQEGRLVQAISDYSKSIELNPNDMQTYFDRGLAYHLQDAFSDAVSDYSKAIALYPEYKDAYAFRGLAYAKQGSLPEAVADCNRAIQIDPQYAKAYSFRGIAYFYQKDFVRAWEDVHKAESLGHEVDPVFLEVLKKATGRDK